jgi:single-strand DNA-binding protein
MRGLSPSSIDNYFAVGTTAIAPERSEGVLMAASVNKVILIGNLGAKPELKYLSSGQAVCELRLATNEQWTDKNQQKQERTEWHRVVVWGKTGENCAQYLDKGRAVYIEGRLQTRSWDDKNTGEKRYMTEIVANSVQFLGGGGEGGGPRGGSRPQGGPGGGSSGGGADDFGPSPGGSSGGDDDIPF